jgi:hypothetical protein
MNVPYVKKLNHLGECINPILEKYQSRRIVGRKDDGSNILAPSRRDRRASLRMVPKLNNRPIKNNRGVIVRIKQHVRAVLNSLNQ